jgi:hypothetical protein
VISFCETFTFGGLQSPPTFVGCHSLLLVQDELLKSNLCPCGFSLYLRPKAAATGSPARSAAAFALTISAAFITSICLKGSCRLLTIVDVVRTALAIDLIENSSRLHANNEGSWSND